MLATSTRGRTGEPYVAEPLIRPPWDGYRLEQYEDNYINPEMISSIIISTLFSSKSDMMSSLFPFQPSDNPVVLLEEWLAYTGIFGPLSSQAPFSESHIQRRAMEAKTTSFGKQFTIDASIHGTKLEHFYDSLHMRQIVSGIHSTVYHHILRTMLAAPTMYEAEKKYVKKQGLSDLSAAESVIDLKSKLFGCLSRSVLHHSPLAVLVSTVRQMLYNSSDWNPEDVPLNFIFLPSHIKSLLPLEMALFRPVFTKYIMDETARYLAKLHIDPKLEHLMNPVEFPNFDGAKVIFIDQERDEGGVMCDPLDSEAQIVQFCVFDPQTDVEVKIIDHNRRTFTTIYKKDVDHLKQFRKPVLAGENTKFADDANERDLLCVASPFTANFDRVRRCIAFRTLRFRMSRVIMGHASEKTGIALLGRDMRDQYYQPDVRRTTFYVAFRFGFVLTHPEHIPTVPDALHKKYLGGGGAKVAPVPAQGTDLAVDADRDALMHVIDDNGTGTGDVYIYAITDDWGETNDILDSLTVTCSGGRWKDPALKDVPAYNWINDDVDNAERMTALRVDDVENMELGLHGVDVSNLSLCR